MALRETDDVETKLGPFGPVNITMKVALQQFVFECVCVVPMLADFCYVLGYSTQKTFSEPFAHALMMKKRSHACKLYIFLVAWTEIPYLVQQTCPVGVLAVLLGGW
jgi:hypothetical protein